LWLEETLLHSTARRRNNDDLQPKLNSYFSYQTPDLQKNLHKQVKKGLRCDEVYGYSNLINCKQWSSYIKDPLHSFAREQYVHFISQLENTTSKKKQLTHAHGILWVSLTSDVGPVEKNRRLINVRHMNAFLIVHRIVYNHSTKLPKGVMHDHLGHNQEMNLTNFITRFGYTMQRGPYLTIHGAYTQYTTLIPKTYIQGCPDNVNQIIPVTLFLVMLYNECFRYQDDKTENLLITALDRFNLGSTVDGDTFMNTFVEFAR
jgi:hypothetical protein